MNILLTFDNNYSQHAGVVMVSFCMNNKGHHVFYVISDEIHDDNQQKLKAIAEQYDCSIHFYFIDCHQTKDFPLGYNMANSYVSIATYFRLFVTEVLPPTVERILYLDCDIVINASLEEIWCYTMNESNCLLALEESPSLSSAGARRLHYPESYSYFNAGVLLIDMVKLRKTYHLNAAINFIKSHEIKFHDQDVLNGMLYDKKQYMDLKYNVMDYHLIKHSAFPQRYQNQTDAIYHPYIIHFSGPVKPWHKECKNPYTFKYYEYLQYTPWYEYVAQEKYNSIKKKSIYILKQTVKRLIEGMHLHYYSFIKI